MRITFTLAAILAASVNATPLAPTKDLSASASTLVQISAQSLDAAPITTDDLWMGQTEADLDTLAEKGEKQKKLAILLEELQSSLTAEKANFETPTENKDMMQTNFDKLSDHLNEMYGEVSDEIQKKYAGLGVYSRWVESMHDVERLLTDLKKTEGNLSDEEEIRVVNHLRYLVDKHQKTMIAGASEAQRFCADHEGKKKLRYEGGLHYFNKCP